MPDETIIAGNVEPSDQAEMIRGFADVAISAGQSVTRDPDSLHIVLADANQTVDFDSKTWTFGIAANSASPGQLVSVVFSDPNLALGIAGMRAGSGGQYCVSAAAPGGITRAANLGSGDFQFFLGLVNDAGNLIVHPTIGGTIV